MGLDCALEGQWAADRDRQRAVLGRGGEVRCGLLLRYGWEVVAAQKTDGHVVEQHGPEREVGAVATGGIGGDDRVVPGDRGVQVNVVGQRDLDDAINAVGRVR